MNRFPDCAAENGRRESMVGIDQKFAKKQKEKKQDGMRNRETNLFGLMKIVWEDSSAFRSFSEENVN